MTKITTVLFDFDGVIANTEVLYDIFTDQLAKEYKLGIENFAQVVKGTTNEYMLEKYFGHLPKNEITNIRNRLNAYEDRMDFPPVNGAIDFVYWLKDRGYKVGLVTSSLESKVNRALLELGLVGAFDTIVTANRIKKAKPDPMCFLLAATDLEVSPAECIVFEDSFNGIKAGLSADMKVIGVSTTIAANQLEELVKVSIPDFENMEELSKIMNDE